MPKFLKSLHFRLGLLYALFFTASALVLGILIVFTTNEFLKQQLKSHAEYGANQLLNDYRQDGIDELRHDIRERVESDHPDRLWYFLQDPTGKMEFDTVDNFPESGWETVQDDGQPLLVLSIPLPDGYKMGVGVSLATVDASARALRNTFVIAIIVTLLLSAIGGYFLSRAFLLKVENLKKTVSSIGQDELHLRVPLSDSEDEFDQLAKIINGMLSRIETLVREVQGVSANIAHDLRTPLGRMKQKLERLTESNDLGAASKESVHEISELLDETLNTFSAILRISEVNSGTRRSEFRTLAVSELLSKISSAYEAVVEDSGRTIKIQSDSDLQIVGDISLLTQLLANLVENTLQHTPEGTHIDIKASRSASGGVVLSVADNGPGIADAERDKVTQPFFKLDRSRNSKGSGLGLSLVAAITKLHGASLKVQNNNPGIKFEITFDA